MKKSIYLLLILLTLNCSGTKKIFERKAKTDTVTNTKETETKETFKAGDTVTIDIPNIKFKDTTIVRYNYETKSSVRVTYDKDGNQKIDCISSEIKELTQIVRDITENKQEEVKEREKEKESFVSDKMVLYVFLGLGFLMILNKVANKFL